MILIPKAVADGIARSGAEWGILTVKISDPDDLIVISGWSRRQDRNYQDPGEWSKGHFTRYSASLPGRGVWYRAPSELHERWDEAWKRLGKIPAEEMKAAVTGWLRPPESGMPALTCVPGDDPDFRAWMVAPERAIPMPLDTFDPDADLLAPLDEGWPRQLLAGKSVTAVGVGSIGSVAVEGLAAYGISHLALVDPQRLVARNFARHRVNRSEHGRFKVLAVADMLRNRDPRLRVDCYPADVGEDADVMRPLFADSDLILCCSDGARSRRVTNYLSFRASKPLVLASVAEFGAYGEVLRHLPGRTGCYLCNRAELDPVLGLDDDVAGDYDNGEPAAPMTAVTGDLALVGQLAAKVAVATLLRGEGRPDQRLPGDQAIVGLRPVPPFEKPFDTAYAGTVDWRTTAISRPDCPVCGSGEST